jgi:nucleotide-binding universal stress UspA family protein
LTDKILKKILVPLDGSNNSLRGLKFALVIAKQSGSSIIGLNVYSYPIFLKNSILKRKIKQNSEKTIKKSEVISQKANVPFTGIIKVSNNIGKTIVTFAESHKVDMIVIGSSGPDPEFEIFLGSVANHVINKSKIPVTIVK